MDYMQMILDLIGEVPEKDLDLVFYLVLALST